MRSPLRRPPRPAPGGAWLPLVLGAALLAGCVELEDSLGPAAEGEGREPFDVEGSSTLTMVGCRDDGCSGAKLEQPTDLHAPWDARGTVTVTWEAMSDAARTLSWSLVRSGEPAAEATGTSPLRVDLDLWAGNYAVRVEPKGPGLVTVAQEIAWNGTLHPTGR